MKTIFVGDNDFPLGTWGNPHGGNDIPQGPKDFPQGAKFRHCGDNDKYSEKIIKKLPGNTWRV
jgi:hypothetical protein